MTGASDEFPTGHADERELLLAWLAYLRRAVLRNLHGLTDEQARWRPQGALISVLGMVRSPPLDQPCEIEEGTDLRWVLLHLINGTARHAGHADATRELFGGAIGE